ncbi:hypothetical protein REPUB_Repub10bG0105100 [Reevesia pubescens]
MAGVDYNEWGLDIEKWENDNSEWPPLHLLAEEEEEEPERIVKHSTQIVGTSTLTNLWEDFDGNCDDNASNGAVVEFMHQRVSQGKTLVERIIKMINRYKIRLLMIAMILGGRDF